MAQGLRLASHTTGRTLAWSVDSSPTPTPPADKAGRWRFGCFRRAAVVSPAASSRTLASTMTATALWRPESPKRDSRQLLLEEARQRFCKYLENPCVHGLKYIGRTDYPPAVRALWGLLFAVSVVGLVGLAYMQAFTPVYTRDTKISVTSTRVLLNRYPFPSVTICPQSSIFKNLGLTILRLSAALESGSAREENATQDAMFVRMMNVLQEFRFPLFTPMFTPLDKEALRQLGTTDARRLLMQTFPPCKYVLIFCAWKEKAFDCCTLFRQQETSSGLCYSFNSCTDITFAAGTVPCKPRPGLSDDSAGLYVSTGVSLESEILDPAPAKRGVKVVVSNPYEIPQPSNGHLLREDEATVSRITVSLTVQDADDSIRSLPWQARNCKFIDEQPLSVTAHYSQRSCIEDCRLRFVAEHCGCIPFYLNPRGDGFEIPQCNATGLECVFNSKHALRRMNSVPLETPWEEHALQVLDKDRGEDCQCPPECAMLKYHAELTDLGTFHGQPYGTNRTGSIIFVRQRNGGASNIRYMISRQLTLSEFLADLGNIAALFLGVSILSVFEFIILSVSCVHTLFRAFIKPPDTN